MVFLLLTGIFSIITGTIISALFIFMLVIFYLGALAVFFHSYPSALKRSLEATDPVEAQNHYRQAMSHKFLGFWSLVVGPPVGLVSSWREWQYYTQKTNALEKEAVRKLYQHHFPFDDGQLDHSAILERPGDMPLPMRIGADGELFTREELTDK